MKPYLLAILYLSFLVISVVSASDCGTPAECYLKALELLQRDREEIRSLTDKLVKKNEDLTNELKSTKVNLEELAKKNENLTNELNSLKINIGLLQKELFDFKNGSNSKLENLTQQVNSKPGRSEFVPLHRYLCNGCSDHFYKTEFDPNIRGYRYEGVAAHVLP